MIVSQAIKRVLILLILVVLFILARWTIYQIVPPEEDWYLADFLKNGPRLAGFVAALWLGLRWWGASRMGWHRHEGKIAAGVSLLLAAFWSLRIFSPTFQFKPLGKETALILAVSTVLVALFEETLFRGAFLPALRDWKGERFAIFGSSIVFTVLHVQAQPVWQWPWLFCHGMLDASLRASGMGLPWLIVMHFGWDMSVLVGGGWTDAPWWYLLLDWIALAVIAAAVYRRWGRQAEMAPPIPTP